MAKNRTTEIKALPVTIKEISGRIVTGFASVFGVLDSYDDIVHPGAFAKTLVEQNGRIKHLWQHDYWAPPTAVIRELRETGRDELPDDVKNKYPEATGGLLVKREYLDTPRGNEILSGIVSGAINEMSFMYDTIQRTWEELLVNGQTMAVRNLFELRLWETSDVIWGANAATVASKGAGPVGVRIDHLSHEVESLMGLLDGNKGRGLDADRLRTALEAVQAALIDEPETTKTVVDHSRLQSKMRAVAMKMRTLELQN
jgi:HK97 family phage prohead protease